MDGNPPTDEVVWALAAAGVLVLVFAPLTIMVYQQRD
jgi:hypothetical protein